MWRLKASYCNSWSLGNQLCKCSYCFLRSAMTSHRCNKENSAFIIIQFFISVMKLYQQQYPRMPSTLPFIAREERGASPEGQNWINCWSQWSQLSLLSFPYSWSHFPVLFFVLALLFKICTKASYTGASERRNVWPQRLEKRAEVPASAITNC